MSLAIRVLIGLVLGILVGIFVGSLSTPLAIIGQIYIRLLQMSVLPYAVVSVVIGLGSMNLGDTKKLGRNVGSILLMLWFLLLASTAAATLAFPNWPSSSFFSPSLVDEPQKLDLIKLYVPENPVSALADNVVPASILFSLFFGAALMVSPNKEHVLAPLEVVSSALMRIVMFVMKFMPIGVFAVSAFAAGTISLEECEQLEVYLTINGVLCTVLALLVLPYTVSQWTGIRFKTLMRAAREMLVLSFATCNVFVTLPLLIDKTTVLVSAELTSSDEFNAAEVAASAELILPIAFNLPMAGELIAMLFVPFAAWSSGFPIAYSQFPAMLLSGFISSFGDIKATIPFLLSLMRVPADSFQLFIMTTPIASHFSAMVSGMYLLSLAVLSVYALSGKLKWSWKAALRSIVVAVVSIGASLALVWTVFTFLVPAHYTKNQILTQRPLLWKHSDMTWLKSKPESAMPLSVGNRLKEIKQRGFIRVGYLTDRIPMCFRNSSNDLVGFDVELMNRLAKDLGVRLELYETDSQSFIKELDAGYCDLVIPGLPVTPERAEQVLLTAPYIDGTLAFLVKDYCRDTFASWDAIRAAGPVKLAVGPTPYYESEVLRRAPGVKFVHVKSVDDFFKRKDEQFDGCLTSAETGSAWSVLYPEYCVAVPRPETIKVPVSYALRRGDTELRDFLTLWIDLKQKDGSVKAAFDYWFLCKSDAARGNRWSIVKDVLHWTK